MTNNGLTLEVLSSLDAGTLKVLSKSPDATVREMSIKVIAERAFAGQAEAIAFAEQSTFTLDGYEVPLKFIAYIAYSSLPTEAKEGISAKTGKAWAVEATPSALAEQGDAWAILRKVQAGYVAQGKTFGLDTKSLRALIG